MNRHFAQIEFEPSELGMQLSEEIYAALRDDITDSKHGARFDNRELNLTDSPDCPSPFNVDVPYLPPIESTDKHRNDIAQLASGLVMREQDWEKLVEAFKTVYGLPEVKQHQASGGVVKFIDSHRTYTGQVMEEIASWEALRQNGVPNPHEIQTTIVSRVTTLFRLQLLEDILEVQEKPHHNGAILEDVLLQYGGALMTIPNTQSGHRLIQAVQNGVHARRNIVERTKTAYEQLVNRGGADGQIFFEGSSGAENHIDKSGYYRIIGEVKHRTVELTTDYNQTEGAERIMTIPIFMDSDPYTGKKDKPIAPKPTAFAFLAPRYPKSQKDFDQMMMEMALAGIIVKASGELPYRYERRALGRNIHPEFIAKNKV